MSLVSRRHSPTPPRTQLPNDGPPRNAKHRRLDKHLETFERHIHGYVAMTLGREIVSGGQLSSVDLDDAHVRLRAAMRDGLPAQRPYLDAWSHLEPAVAGFYRDALGCC